MVSIMRILHLDSGREMRGGQWQALRLHRSLIEAGHQSLLLAREGSPLLEADPQSGVLHPLRLGLLSRAFDLVHAHDARSHTLAALFSRVPFVVSRRVAFPVRDSAISRWKYRRPALFLAVSRHVATQLRNAGVEERRIEVVYDGVAVPEQPANVTFAGPGKRTLYIIGGGADDENGQPIRQGPQQTAATIYKLPVLAQGLKGRAK